MLKNSTLLFTIIGVLLLGSSFYTQAKALLAQELIARAWDNVTLNQDPKQAKPWPWADTFPVAKLKLNNLGLDDLYVLNSHSGEALSFGPGYHPKTALPGSTGDSVVAGHRDSHFAFLEGLHIGDVFSAENYLGNNQEYQVQSIKIIDSSKEKIKVDSDQNRLQLITCYPFNTLTNNGPMRYVVIANQIVSP